MNIIYKRRRLSKEDKLRMANEYNAGRLTIDEILAKYRIKRSTLYSILNTVKRTSE